MCPSVCPSGPLLGLPLQPVQAEDRPRCAGDHISGLLPPQDIGPVSFIVILAYASEEIAESPNTVSPLPRVLPFPFLTDQKPEPLSVLTSIS